MTEVLIGLIVCAFAFLLGIICDAARDCANTLRRIEDWQHERSRRERTGGA